MMLSFIKTVCGEAHVLTLNVPMEKCNFLIYCITNLLFLISSSRYQEGESLNFVQFGKLPI